MKWKINALAFTAYLALSLLLTYPLALDFGSKVPGYYDVWQNIWNFWWVDKAVFQLKTNPYFTPYLFHPTGVGLAFHTLELGNSFAGAVISRHWTLAAAYNTLVLLSFVLAGYGMFALAKHVVGDSKAAFAAGLVYAFSPYHFMEVNAGHLNLLSIQWIPFYVLYLMKTFNEGGRGNSTLMALSFFAVSSTCLQYMGFVGLFTAFYLAFELFREKAEFTGKAARLIPPAILSAILIAPLIYPLAVEMIKGGGVSSPLSASIHYSQDFIAFFSPHPMNPIFGGIAERVSNVIASEHAYGRIYAAGYIVLILVAAYFNREYAIFEKFGKIWGLFQNKKTAIPIVVLTAYIILVNRVFGLDILKILADSAALSIALLAYFFLKSAKIDFWSASLILFGVLSMGPVMHFAGYVTLPLPYVLLYLIPGFSIFRVPARFDLLFMLSAAVISAKSISWVEKKRGSYAAYIVMLLVLLEYLSAPLAVGWVNAPEFYTQIAADGGGYAVMDVPVAPIRIQTDNATWENGLPHYMLYQTVHGKKMVGGYVSYPTKGAKAFISSNPFLHKMNDLEGPSNESVEALVEIGRRTLAENDIGYIIVHKDVIGEPQLYRRETLNKTRDIISLVSRGKLIFDDDRIAVYYLGPDK